MPDNKNIEELLEDVNKEYDRTYIKSEIDVDQLIEKYVEDRRGNVVGTLEKDEDAELQSYIKQVDEIIKKNPALANDADTQDSEENLKKLSDTKEFYKLAVAPKADVKREETIPEKKETKGNKARISTVKEFVQTTFEGIGEDEEPLEASDKVFVVSIPEEKFEKGIKAGIISFEKPQEEPSDPVLEEAVAEDGEVDVEKLSRYLNEDLFVTIKKKIHKIKQDYACYIHPFDKEKDKSHVRNELVKAVSRRRGMVFIQALLTLVLIYLALTQTLELPMIPHVSYGTIWFMLINLFIYTFIVFNSLEIYKKAICALICKTSSIELALAALSFVTIVHTIMLTIKGSNGFYTYLAIPALITYFYMVYIFEQVKKIKTDFKLLSFKPDKTCGSLIEDTAMVEQILGDDEVVAANVKKYSTIDCSDFFTKSTVSSNSSVVIKVITPLAIVIAIIAFIYVQITGKGFLNALSTSVISMCTMFTCGLGIMCIMPYTSFSKRLKYSGAAIIGAKTAEDFSKVETLIIDDSYLFPTKTLQLCGTKRYNDQDVKELIVYTVSALDTIQGPLALMMMDVIDNRRELLLEADSVTYFDEKGISAYVDGNKILIGNNMFMRDNLIKIPADGTAEKIEKSGKIPLYIAVNGVLAAIFSIKYTENPVIKKRIAKLVSNGVSFAVKTRDPSLTRSFICAKYDIPESMLKVLPVSLAQVEEAIPGGKYTPDVITITKDVSAFFRAHTTANKIRIATIINTVICVLSFFFGIVVTAMMCISPMFVETAKPVLVLLLQIAWLIPMGVISFLIKQTI